MNGDIIGRDGNNAPIRYRSANGTWEHIGSNTGLPNLFAPRCEDASGNFYAQSLSYNADNWMLPSGTSTWQHFVSPDADSIAVTAPYNSVPFANTKGELVVQTHTTKNGVEHARIYRKAAGSSSWALASERTPDYYNIVSLADNGDVFFTNASYPLNGPMVLRAGSNTLVSMVDCATTIQPYCNSFYIQPNTTGDVLWYQGGIGSPKMYKMTAPASYPALATYVCDLPPTTCCGSQLLLPNGTMVARLNDGTYDFYHLYIRKPGAGSWTDAGLLPNEDGSHDVEILANGKGEVFTWNISLASVSSTGHVYRVRF